MIPERDGVARGQAERPPPAWQDEATDAGFTKGPPAP